MNMYVQIAKKATATLMLLSLFTDCGELDTLLPSDGTYQVKALVNNSSLEDCSLISSTDKIRPYFAHSVTKDPDLTGLVVFLQNQQGEIAGKKTRYILQNFAGDTPFLEPEFKPEPPKTEEPDELLSLEDNDKLENNDKKEKTAGDEETDKEEPDVPDTETTVSMEKPVEKLETPPVKTSPVSPVIENEDTIIVVKSLDENIPYFPLPANLEIGQYTLVFQVLGREETLHRTETTIYYLGSAKFKLNDIQMYLPGVSSGSRLISPGITVMLEARLSFDQRLDPYIRWYNGKNILSEGRLADGEGKILWKAPEQTGFHTVRVEVFPFRLRQGISGISREISLPVSLKAATTDYFTGDTLLSIAKITPPPVPDTQDAVLTDSPQVRIQSVAMETAAPDKPELVHWYQFSGNLQDTKTPISAEQSLIPVNEKPPRWIPVAYSYGLSTSADESYLLPPVAFFPEGEESGGGQFLFHIKPVSDGEIFNARFALQASSNEYAEIYLLQKGTAFVLRLNAPGAQALETPVSFAAHENGSYITAVIDFFIRPYRLEARLRLGPETLEPIEAKSIAIAGPLKGECRIRLGGLAVAEIQKQKMPAGNTPVSSAAKKTPLPEVPPAEQAFIQPAVFPLPDTGSTNKAAEEQGIAIEAESGKQPAADTAVQAAVVWNEFALLYSAIPLLPEEPVILIEDNLLEEEIDEMETAAVNPKPANTETKKTDARKAATEQPPEDTQKPVENENALPEPDSGPAAIPLGKTLSSANVPPNSETKPFDISENA
jgi:hypothetical protein